MGVRCTCTSKERVHNTLVIVEELNVPYYRVIFYHKVFAAIMICRFIFHLNNKSV